LVRLRAAVRARGVAVVYLHAGERVGPNRVLWPPAGRSFSASNDGCLALAVDAGASKLLLPGDLTGYPLLEFTQSLEEEVDLLLLPHDGNGDAGLASLLRRVRPRLALASRSDGEWTDSTRRALIERGVPWLMTARGGAIGFSAREDSLDLGRR